MHKEKDANEQIKKIAHIGIAVHNVEQAIPFYQDSLGLELEGMEQVETEGVKVAFFKIGESRLELLEPLHTSSPIHGFLQKRGEGIHHIALEVDDIQKRLQTLKEKGIRLIHDEPKEGANDAQIAFLHPKSTNGVLLELCQHKKGE